MRQFWETIAVSTVMSIVVAATALFVYDSYFKQEIVVFDVPAYVKVLKEKFLKGDISEEALKERFNHLDTRLKDISRKSIILNQQAVIAGGRELSDEIE